MKRGLLVIMILLIFTVPASFGVSEYTDDENNDGKPDKWFTFEGEILLRVECDENFDGIVDNIVAYDKDGRRDFEQYDFNFDGVMDDFYYYDEGILSRREIDSNFDNKIDIWLYLSEGKYITRLEQDKDFDGNPDLIKDY